MSSESIASRLRDKRNINKTIGESNDDKLRQQKRRRTNKNNKLSKKIIKFESNLTIDDLNDYVLELILSFLSLRDKIRSQLVSKRWQQLVNSLLRKQTSIGMKNIAYNRGDCSLIARHSVKEGDIIDRAIFVFNPSSDGNEHLSYYDFRNAVQRPHEQCIRNLRSIFRKCPQILSLDLRSIQLSDSLVNLVADYCPRLECLHLNSMIITDGVWQTLSDRLAKQLIHLTIRNSIKSDQEPIVQNLIRSSVKLKCLKVTEWTPEVRGKWLDNISDSVEEVHIACTSAVNVFENINTENTKHIKKLKLSTFEALSQSVIDSIGTNFLNLTQINLRNCEDFNKRSYKPIASLVQLQELRIDLPFANCDDDFMIMCQRCTKMRSIELNFGYLTLNSLQIIGKYWPQLESVSFRLVTIEKLNSDALLVLQNLQNLRKLCLHGTNINDNICRVIHSSKSLRYLNLDLCHSISKTVVKQFIDSSKLRPKELFELSVKETKINKIKNLNNSLVINDGTVRLNNLFIYCTVEDL